MIQHQRNINMYPGVRAPERIHLSQYDSDFTLVFSLYSSAGSFSVDSGTTAMIRGTKGDGNGYSANASLSGTTVTVQGNNQMTAVAGPNTFELVLTRSGKVLSTANFILDVEPAAMDADTIESKTVLKELQAIIDSASTSTAAATRAEEAAAAAEGHVEGTVRFDIAQSKTEAEKAQARANIGAISDGLTEDIKTALLACFRHIPFLDSDDDYYGNLRDALYGVEPTSGTVDISDYVIGNFNTSNNMIQYDGIASDRIFPNPIIYKVMPGNVIYTAKLNNSNYRVTIGRIKSTAENDSLVTQGVTKIILSSFTVRDGSTLPWTEGEGSLNVNGYDYIMPVIKRADNGTMTANDVAIIQNAYSLTWEVQEDG